MSNETKAWARGELAPPTEGHWMDAWDDAMEAPAIVFDRALRVTWRSPRLALLLDHLDDAETFSDVFPDFSDQAAGLRAAFDGGSLPLGGVHSGFRVGFQRGPQGQEILALIQRPDREMGVSLNAAALSTLTHEMRTPLNAVVGMAELLGQTDLDRVQRRYVSVCRSAADNLLDLINNFLDLQKLSAGHLDLETEPFYLPDLLDSVMEIMSVRAYQRGLDLLTDIDAETPRYLVGDTYRLRQVLMNLVGNATKFTEYGHIRVHVTRGAGEHIIQFVVEDTGPGVAADQHARLFRPFWQLSAESAKRNMGTGLGLSISRQLVERMGGRIWYEPRTGEESGSRFCFTCSLQPQAVTPRVTLEPHARLLRGAVLVVHQSEAVRENLVRALSSWGVDAVGAEGMAHLESLFAARSTKDAFEVVICDDMLLGTIGDRLGAGRPGLKVVKLIQPEQAGTTHDDAVAVIIKPVRRAEFFETLNGLFARPKSTPRTTRTSLLLRQRTMATGRRVLVIDDSEDNRLIVESMLRAHGAEVDTFGTAASGLDALFAHPRAYNLVLLDLSMPDMSGYDALKEIRAVGDNTGSWLPPVLAFTALSDPRDVQSCLAAGFAGHVGKPVTLAGIVATVDRYAQTPPPAYASEVNEARMTLLRGDFAGLMLLAERLVGKGAEPSLCGDLKHAAETRDRTGVTRVLNRLAEGALSPPASPKVEQEFPGAMDEAIAELLPEFFERRWQDIVALRVALAAEDRDRFRTVGHQVAGTGATFGFANLSDLGRRMERTAKTTDGGDLGPLLHEFEVMMREADPAGEPPA